MIMCADHHCDVALCGCDPDEQYRLAQSASGAHAMGDARHADALRALLLEVRDACLYAEDDGEIGVTSEPTIDSDLFDRICAEVRAPQPEPLTVPEPAANADEMAVVCRELRDRLMAFVGALALSTDCSADVDVIKRADALLQKREA